jgi:hypothetical protein
MNQGGQTDRQSALPCFYVFSESQPATNATDGDG